MTRRSREERSRWRSLARAWPACALAALATLAHARRADAQAGSCAGTRADGPAASWQAPLDRRVVVHGHDLSLRDALDRIAAAARIRLSYSGDLLPLDRGVCAAFDSVAAGDALAELLRGTALEPVITGGDQVVLAPRPTAAAAPPAISPRVSVLDRVVVTGSAAGASERPLTVALDVVTGPQLARRDAATLAQALDGAVPGMWMWTQSPASLLASYGSIRGASSFGMSSPKIYVDGIEVADPLLLTRVLPEAIDRVEVIRGPQGAALYGADAISGVVNIVTRHAPDDSTGAHAVLRTGAGMSQSAFAAHGALVQDHVLALDGGSARRSASLALGLGTMGEFVPGAFSRDVQGTAGLRLVGARASLTGTARVYASEAGMAANPLVTTIAGGPVLARRLDARDGAVASDSTPALAGADSEPQGVREYTLGATARFAADARWTHSLVVGIDGYRLRKLGDDDTPLPSRADSALRAAGGGADRATLRASSVARFGAAGRAGATLTFAVEQSTTRAIAPVDRDSGGPLDPLRAPSETALWWSSTGLVAQSDLAFRDALFVTGGLRLERDAAFAGGSQLTALPMLGAALVRDYGPLTLKLRGAYGRGMRPAASSVRALAWMGQRRHSLGTLAPEEQSGVEGGADLLLGAALALHVTRFDQRAFGLIQPVGIADSTAVLSGAGRRMAYVLQNVGEIANRGWELQGSARAGHLALSGALSLVDSRVRRLAPAYTGDLRPGDRMVAVPARTASGMLSWIGGAWTASATVARAADWTDYDRLAIARAWASGVDPRQLTGAQLRAFWRDYPGVTRLGATFSRRLTRDFSLLLTGDNLLNRQRGEPDNLTIVPGRTLTAGLRAAF